MAYQSLVFSIIFIFSLFAGAQADSDVVQADDKAKVVVEEAEVKETDEAKKAKDKKNQEYGKKIEVTGSYVRRIDIEGPTPVVHHRKRAILKWPVWTLFLITLEKTLCFSSTEDSGKPGWLFQLSWTACRKYSCF